MSAVSLRRVHIQTRLDTTDALDIPPQGEMDSRLEWTCFTVTASVAFILYLSTLAPNVTLGFSGILSAGAMYAGVPHPPGYPVWTLYSWLFANFLPISNIAWRIAFGSALAAALAGGFVAWMVSQAGKLFLTNDSHSFRLTSMEKKLLRFACGFVSGMALCFCGTLWSKAVIVDVHAPGILMFSVVLWTLMRWMLRPHQRKFLYVAFAVCGLLLAEHPIMMLVMPALVLMVMLGDQSVGRDMVIIVLPLGLLAVGWYQFEYWGDFSPIYQWPVRWVYALSSLMILFPIMHTRRLGTEWKTSLFCLLIFAMCFAIQWYAPLASMTNPPVNWAYPRTVEGFKHLLGRGQYENYNPVGELGVYLEQLRMMARVAAEDIGWPYLPFAAIPFIAVFRSNGFIRRFLIGLVAMFLCTGPLMIAMLNPALDRQSVGFTKPFFLSAYVIFAIWIGIGLTSAVFFLATRCLGNRGAR
jgi:hypothetical protein